MLKSIRLLNTRLGPVAVCFLEDDAGLPYYRVLNLATDRSFELHEGMFLQHNLSWEDNVELRILGEKGI